MDHATEDFPHVQQGWYSGLLGQDLLSPSPPKSPGDPGADLDSPCVKLSSPESGGNIATDFRQIKLSVLFF